MNLDFPFFALAGHALHNHAAGRLLQCILAAKPLHILFRNLPKRRRHFRRASGLRKG